MKNLLIGLFILGLVLVVSDMLSVDYYSADYDYVPTEYNITYRVFKEMTFDDMCVFLENDATNTMKYNWDDFNCVDFSQMMIVNAHAQDYDCGYVYVHGVGIDHAIVCFNTTDRGLIFVEPQNDLMIEQSVFEEMINNGEWEPFKLAINGNGLDTIGGVNPRGDYLIDWYMFCPPVYEEVIID